MKEGKKLSIQSQGMVKQKIGEIRHINNLIYSGTLCLIGFNYTRLGSETLNSF